MKKLSACVCFLFTPVFLVSLSAAPGEVTVTIDQSPDQSAWSAGSTGELDVSTPVYLRATIVPSDGGTTRYSEVVLADTSHAGNTVDVSLESSTELSGWTADNTGVHDVSGNPKFFRVRTATSYNHFVFVAGGTFTMTASSSSRETTVSDFYIGTFEVSEEEWNLIAGWAGNNGYTDLPTGGGCESGDHPVASISWYDAVKWCNARSEMEGRTPVYYTDDLHTVVYRTGVHDVTNTQADWSANGYRLPTEAEWQFAASGGTLSNGYTYSGSNTVGNVAWYANNSSGADCNLSSGRGTWPVGQKAANELGTFDMSGNVYEWCWDWGALTFASDPVTDPLGPASDAGVGRIRRGGSYDQPDANCSVSARAGAAPAGTAPLIGFRVVYRDPIVASATALPGNSRNQPSGLLKKSGKLIR